MADGRPGGDLAHVREPRRGRHPQRLGKGAPLKGVYAAAPAGA
ncbi:hypothetical protein [Streptomyces inhibens]|nr:hypothetical protein [Streptomyces inhibens]